MTRPEMRHFLYLIIVLSFGFQTSISGQTTPDSGNSLSNGIYLVESRHTIKPETNVEAGGLLIPFSHQFLDDNVDGQPRYLVIDTGTFVPMDIVERPLRLRDSEGKSKLVISLAPESRASLKSMTTEHVGASVAVVINGEAVTIHKIREPIDSGKIQITRCTDNACEYLYSVLK